MFASIFASETNIQFVKFEASCHKSRSIDHIQFIGCWYIWQGDRSPDKIAFLEWPEIFFHEGRRRSGAGLWMERIFQVSKSSNYPGLDVSPSLVSTKSLYKHMWWYITFLHARVSNSHCCHTHAGTSFQTQHVHTCPWMLLTIFQTLQFFGSDGVNSALVPLINLFLF